MDHDLVAAFLSLAGSLVGTLAGILASTKLTNFRLKQLETRVQAHNSLIERTYKLEGEMTECKHDIRDLKSLFRP